MNWKRKEGQSYEDFVEQRKLGDKLMARMLKGRVIEQPQTVSRKDRRSKRYLEFIKEQKRKQLHARINSSTDADTEGREDSSNEGTPGEDSGANQLPRLFPIRIPGNQSEQTTAERSATLARGGVK